MNYIYFGAPSDLNIGNGKTISAVRQICNEYVEQGKKIYSNIKICGLPYVQLKPDTLFDVLEVENAVLLFDEIHAIIHKNHKIHERCTKHDSIGLCYLVTEFLRQVRKRRITTISTCQVFSDCHFQLRGVMQELILSEKYNHSSCGLEKCQKDDCPSGHRHYIRNLNVRTGTEIYFNPEPYYDIYDSSEIVKGWVSFD